MTTFGDMVFQMGGIPVGPELLMTVDKVWFVDGVSGSDDNDGLSWDKAVKTIAKAITKNNATINWSYTPKRYNAIFIKPGVYAENITSLPYYCHVIGGGIRGTDTAVEIHPTTGACMAGTGLGLHLKNIWFEVNEAVPCLDFGICNNSLIEDCTFANGAAVAATGIDTENCTHLEVRNCSFESGQTTILAYGFYFRGGANKYAHNVRIHDNVIFASTAGIYIQDTCTASQFAAYRNMIGPGDCAKGVDDNNGGSYLFGNLITGVDAIEHANSTTQCIGNSVSNNGTGAKETANS